MSLSKPASSARANRGKVIMTPRVSLSQSGKTDFLGLKKPSMVQQTLIVRCAELMKLRDCQTKVITKRQRSIKGKVIC